MSARVPKKGALLQNGENIRSPSVEPHTDGRCTYNRVWPGSPRGLLMALLSVPQWHATLGTILSTLAWVDQPACGSNPQQGTPSTPVTASSVTKGRVEYVSMIPEGTDKGLDLLEALDGID
jgi:hypothetical protein